MRQDVQSEKWVVGPANGTLTFIKTPGKNRYWEVYTSGEGQHAGALLVGPEDEEWEYFPRREDSSNLLVVHMADIVAFVGQLD
jgi:hypothetical protein